jgi:hypothetical protein
MFEAERGDDGKFLTKPKGIEQYAITSENASEMAKKRWQKFREAAADAVTKEIGSIAPDATTPEAAWGVLNARLAVQIMDSEKPRGRDLDSLGQNIGAKPNVSERSGEENPVPAAASAFGSELARQFMAIIGDVMQAKQQPPAADVIDVQADNVTRTSPD